MIGLGCPYCSEHEIRVDPLRPHSEIGLRGAEASFQENLRK